MEGRRLRATGGVSVEDRGGVEGGGVMALPRWTKDTVLDQRAPGVGGGGRRDRARGWEDWGGEVSGAEGKAGGGGKEVAMTNEEQRPETTARCAGARTDTRGVPSVRRAVHRPCGLLLAACLLSACSGSQRSVLDEGSPHSLPRLKTRNRLSKTGTRR